jgi:hypothetical protein
MENTITTTLQVYRDGQLDKAFYRQQRIAAAKQAVKMAAWRVLRAIAQVFVNVGHNVATMVKIKAYDALHGTHYYDQLMAKWERERDEAFAKKIGLRA